jgi:oxalate decarboxylase/phosphoglucose isomerase-like protein (cupin superfamily)
MKNGFDPKNYNISPHQETIKKPWGYEIIFTPHDALAVGKILHIIKGRRLSLQYHDTKTETLCLFRGKANITLTNNSGEEIEIPMEINKGYFIKPGQVHRVTAITNIDIVESSTPEKGNTVRVQDDLGRITETEEMRKLPNRGWEK